MARAGPIAAKEHGGPPQSCAASHTGFPWQLPAISAGVFSQCLARVDDCLYPAGLVRGEPSKCLRRLVQCQLVGDQSPNVDLLLLDELDRAWIDMAHATRELHRKAAPAGLRCRKRVEIAVWNADEHDPAADPSGANRIPEAIGRIRSLDDERGTEPFRPLDDLVEMGRHRCRP